MSRAGDVEAEVWTRLERAEFVLWAMATGWTVVILTAALNALGKIIG